MNAAAAVSQSTRDIERSQPGQKSKLPPFKHRSDSSTIELFYDLFFVANLASFSGNHEIVDSKSEPLPFLVVA